VQPRRWLGADGATNLALLVLLGAVWGVSFMVITMGFASFSPLLLAAIRFDLAGALLLAVAAAWRPGALVPRGRRAWMAVAFASLLNVAAYHGFLFWGQQYTLEAVAAVIVGLNPLLTTAFSRWLLEDERVGPSGFVGLALGFAGIGVLALLKPGATFDAVGLGQLAVLAAVASWALGSVLVRRQRVDLHPIVLTAWQCLLGAVVLHAASLATEGGGRAVFDANGLFALFYLAVVSTAFGLALYFTLHRRVGPIRVNLVSHIVPVFATLSGFLVLGTPIEARTILAFVLIVAGFALVLRPVHRRQDHK